MGIIGTVERRPHVSSSAALSVSAGMANVRNIRESGYYSVNEVLFYFGITGSFVTLSRSEGSLSALNKRFFASLRMTDDLPKTVVNFIDRVLCSARSQIEECRDRRALIAQDLADHRAGSTTIFADAVRPRAG